MKKVIPGFFLLILSHFVCAQFTPLFLFDGAISGTASHSTLIFDGTYLYGTTSSGPDNENGTGDGTVFRILPDGSAYETLHEFLAEPDGNTPVCGLYSDGTWLYGTTKDGGQYSDGTIYKIKPDGSEYQIIFNFDGAAQGQWGHGGLISDGTYLYGMTYRGGTSMFGTIYRILPDGTGYEKLHDFDGANTGKYPDGELLLYDNVLYGLTQVGGANDDGVMFRIDLDGGNFEKLMDFEIESSGEYCMSSLLAWDGWLYAMNQSGGENGQGLLFKIQPDGSNFTVLLNFELLPTGRAGTSTPITDGTYLYCMTQYGGLYDDGVIFRIKPDGTEFLKMFEFNQNETGANPTAGLVMIDDFVYGVTNIGAANSDGLIFKYQYQESNGVDDSVASTFKLFPNPASESLSFRTTDNTSSPIERITVTDSSGRIVWQSSQVSPIFSLDVSHFAKGLYFLSVQYNASANFRTFVVAR